MKLDTAVWILVLYFCTKLSICRSKGASNDNDGLCDIKIWYLDMITEGAFEGQLTKEQQKIKTSVRKLMSKKKGSMKMDCDILKMYAETLLSGKSDDDENVEEELDDNSDEKPDKDVEGIKDVEKNNEDGVVEKTESTDKSGQDVNVDSKDITPKDELIGGNNATRIPLAQKHQTFTNISSGTMAFIIHCLQTIPVHLKVSGSTQDMYVWGDVRFISTDLKDKDSSNISQHADSVKGVCQDTYHVLCEAKSMFRQISFSWQKSQESLEIPIPKRNVENCDICEAADFYTRRICYYKYLFTWHMGKTHEEHLPPLKSLGQHVKVPLDICKTVYHRFCEVESLLRQMCFPWHETKFLPQEPVPKSAVSDCFACRFKNVDETPRICYFKYIILGQMSSPMRDDNKSSVGLEFIMPVNVYLNKCQSCRKMCSKYCQYLYYLWTMSPTDAKSYVFEPNYNNVMDTMNNTTTLDNKVKDKSVTDVSNKAESTEDETQRGTVDEAGTSDTRTDDTSAHTDLKKTNDVDEESNSNKNKTKSTENKSSSVSGDENTILSKDSDKSKDLSDSDIQSITQILETSDSENPEESDKNVKDGMPSDDAKNIINGQPNENSQESTQAEKDSKSTDALTANGSPPSITHEENTSGKEGEKLVFSGQDLEINKAEHKKENEVSKETKGKSDMITVKTDSKSASNEAFLDENADGPDPTNLSSEKKDETSASILVDDSHKTQENTKECKKEINQTEKDGGSPGGSLDQQTKEELEAKHMELKQYLEQKRQEYSDKIQNLEVHLLKLENKLLVDTLNKNNNSATFTKLENHILKIENELLKINHSFALLKAEGDKLRHYQMSTANELELVRKRENKYPALPGNDTFLDIIQKQRGEISHLSDIIGKQTKAIQNLQTNLKQMKTQNGLLKDIMKEQSELTEELKTKMSRMEKEQQTQREQLKQAMAYLQKYQGADNQPETPDTPDVSSTVRKRYSDVDQIKHPEKVDEEQPKEQKSSALSIDNELEEADKQQDKEDRDIQSDKKDEASEYVDDEIGLKSSADEDENVGDEIREDKEEDIDNANQEEQSFEESEENGTQDQGTQNANDEEESSEEGTGGVEEDKQKGDDELEDAYDNKENDRDYKLGNQDEEENLKDADEKERETADDKDEKNEEKIEQEIQDDDSAQQNDEQDEHDAKDQVMGTIQAAEEDNEDIPAAEYDETQDQQTIDAGNVDDKIDSNDESDDDTKQNNDEQDLETKDNVDGQDQEIKVTEEVHDTPVKSKSEVKDSGSRKPNDGQKKIAKMTDKAKGDSKKKSTKMHTEDRGKEPIGNTGVVKKAKGKSSTKSKKPAKQEITANDTKKPSKLVTEKVKGQDIKETDNKIRKDLKSNKQKTDKSKSSKTAKKTTTETKDSEVSKDKKISSKISGTPTQTKGKGDKIKSTETVSKASNNAKKDIPVKDKETKENITNKKVKTPKRGKVSGTNTETIIETGHKKQGDGVKKDGTKAEKKKTVEEREPKVAKDTQTDKGKKKKKKKGKKTTDTPPTPVFAHIQQDDPKDCYDHYMSGRKRDTSLSIRLAGMDRKIEVYCDMKKGGWTVIQRRMSGSLSFFREWSEYKKGFGDIWGDHWLGNDNIHALTNQGHYSLRIEMMDWDRKKVYAQYDLFLVEGEDQGYKLHVAGYEGDAGDGLLKHNKMKFSTKDVDNDLAVKDFNGNCAERFTGAWWYYKCYKSNLNGKYYRGGTVAEKKFDGVAWKAWKGSNYSLKYVEMKVKPYVPK